MVCCVVFFSSFIETEVTSCPVTFWSGFLSVLLRGRVGLRGRQGPVQILYTRRVVRRSNSFLQTSQLNVINGPGDYVLLLFLLDSYNSCMPLRCIVEEFMKP